MPPVQQPAPPPNSSSAVTTTALTTSSLPPQTLTTPQYIHQPYSFYASNTSSNSASNPRLNSTSSGGQQSQQNPALYKTMTSATLNRHAAHLHHHLHPVSTSQPQHPHLPSSQYSFVAGSTTGADNSSRYNIPHHHLMGGNNQSQPNSSGLQVTDYY